MSKWCTLRALSRNEADIYLYGQVAEWDEVNAAQFAIELNAAASIYAQINIHINSPGGSIFEGLAIYNLIKQCKANVDTYIDGFAASMGSVLAMGGRRIYMARNARLMIHEPQGGDFTTAENLRQMADLMDGLKKDLAAIYATRAKKDKQWVIDNWLSDGKDNWFDYEQAKAAGLVDGTFDSDVKNPGLSLRDFKAIAAHYSGLTIPNTKYDSMKSIIAFFNTLMLGMTLSDEANESQILGGLQHLVNKHREALAGKDQKITELTNQVNTYKEAKEAAEAQAKDDKAISLIEGALQAKKIVAAQKEHFEKLAKADYDAAKAVLDGMTGYTSVMSQLKTGDLSAADKVKKFDELHKGGNLADLKSSDWDSYADLFKAKYGKEPKK